MPRWQCRCCARHDLLVRVKAVSVNPVDAKQRAGGPAGTPVPNPPKIVGWDAAGIVEALGPKAHLFQVGDPVFFAGDITRRVLTLSL